MVIRRACCWFKESHGRRDERTIWLSVVWICLRETRLRLRLGLVNLLTLIAGVSRVVLLKAVFWWAFALNLPRSLVWRFELNMRMRRVIKVDHRVVCGRILEAQIALVTILVLNCVDRGCLSAWVGTTPFLSQHWRLIEIVLCMGALLVDKEWGWLNVGLLSFCKVVKSWIY